jgi:hypothetical protein
VSDAADPVVRATLKTPGSAMMAALSGRHLAVADGSAGIAIVDVGDPDHPRLVWPARWMGYVRSVRFWEGRLFVCAGSTGIIILSVDGEGRAAVLETIETGGDARDIDFHGNFAFVADGEAGVSVIDIGNKAGGEAKRLATLETPGSARGVAFARGYVFVGVGENGVACFRLEQTGRLSLAQTLDASGRDAGRLTVDGNTLYVAGDSGGWAAYDIHRPEAPRLLR